MIGEAILSQCHVEQGCAVVVHSLHTAGAIKDVRYYCMHAALDKARRRFHGSYIEYVQCNTQATPTHKELASLHKRQHKFIALPPYW